MGTNGDLAERFVLNDGSGAIPALGFGTSLSDRAKTRDAVKAAVEAGFRHLDAAERYRNEAEVGAALHELFAAGTVRRDELFVTTKLWNNNHRPERVKPALQASLTRLGLDAVDLYLVHTPFAFAPGDDQDPRDARGAVRYDDGVTLAETWAAIESLVDEGLTRSIGLSDIDSVGTRSVFDAARIKPAVVEVESHPYHPQWELHELCKTHGIVLFGLRFAGPRAGTAAARRSAHRLDRPAPPEDAGAGAAGLGHSARQRRPYVIGQPGTHPRELRRHRAPGERDPRHQRAARNALSVQLRGRRGEPGFAEVPVDTR